MDVLDLIVVYAQRIQLCCSETLFSNEYDYIVLRVAEFPKNVRNMKLSFFNLYIFYVRTRHISQVSKPSTFHVLSAFKISMIDERMSDFYRRQEHEIHVLIFYSGAARSFPNTANSQEWMME